MRSGQQRTVCDSKSLRGLRDGGSRNAVLPAGAVCREEVSHTATYFCLITEAALQVIDRAEAAARRPRLAYLHRMHDGRRQRATWPRVETRSLLLYAAGRT